MPNKTLICLSFPSWEGNYNKSTVELMKEYSNFQKVIYIDYPYTLLDIIRNNNAPIDRILKCKNLTISEHPNLKIYNLPAIIPFQSIKVKSILSLILFINAWLIRKRINKIRKIEGIRNAEWLCALNPFIGNILKAKYQNEHFNYYCYDDIASMKWVNKRSIEEEELFIKKSKSVLCSSNKLLEKCKKFNANVHLIENGVNTNTFLSHKTSKTNENIIGYVGSIDDRLDIELLEQLFQSNLNYKFQFIGRVVDEEVKRKLINHKNVELVAPVAPTLLPSYIAKFKAGLIPFVKNQFTENIFPMKVNEYLALGVPVISTNFSDLSSLMNVIKIADNNNAFLGYLTSEISNDSAIKRQIRIEFAKTQSWTNKALKMHAVLSNQ